MLFRSVEAVNQGGGGDQAVFPSHDKKYGKVVINANRFPKGQYGLYGGVDLVAAASGAVASEIGRQSPKLTSKIKVVPNAIDEGFLKARKGDRRWEMGDGEGEVGLGLRLRLRNEQRGNGRLTVLYAGRIHPEKGVELLLEAWKRLDEIRCRCESICSCRC